MHWHEAINPTLNFPCLKKFSQTCFVFDVVRCCQVEKTDEVSRNGFVWDVVKFEIDEVSQKSFVFKLADRQIER